MGLYQALNVVRVLMSLELLLNAVNLNFAAFSTCMDSLELKGYVFVALFVLVDMCYARLC